MSIHNDGKYSPYIIGGGFFSILARGNINVSDDAAALDFGLENSVKSDYGAIFGIGIDLQASDNGWLFLEVRYDYSLTGAIQNEDQKSRVFGFRTGYWF